MRKTIIAASLASAAFAVPQLAAAQAAPSAEPASPHTFTGNLGIVSDYRFRGISQTFKQPAIQGGVDYSHSSGFYVGNWDSSINTGAGFPGGSIEMDLYGGWKKTWGDWGLDVGAIYYYYPGTDATAANFPANPKNGKTHTGGVHNTELYVGGSWKWLSVKYYYGVSDYFSLPDTKHSNYLDVSGTYDLGNGWGIVGHVGHQKVKNYSDASYTDWKLGVTKDLGFGTVGLSYVDTNANGDCGIGGTTQPYCNAYGKDLGSGRAVLSFTKTF